MNKRKIAILAASGIAVISTAAYAATQLDFTAPIVTSNDATSLNSAFKTKLVRTASGMLITAYGDARDAAKVVYDVKGQVERPARDIFVRSCDANTVDCSDEANWSAETNISNTAALTSIQTDWTGTSDGFTTRTDFWGDSDKPNIVNAGTRVQLTWVDKYCPTLTVNPTAQRTVTYLTLESREIPFSCVYVANSDDNGLTWSTEKQLTDGSRDAKQDASKTASDGHAIITWQEDPLGLLRGDGDGPGDGASGAKVSHATEIWHTTTDLWEAGGSPTWATPVALTDNQTTGTATGNHDDIKDAEGALVLDTDIDGGLVGASRANVGLIGTTAVVAYEETKNSDGLDEGKYIRYHSFEYNVGGTDNVGCIISNPVENARRVRFVTQIPPGGAGSNTTMGIFWKEGNYDQGGPSDIMVRRGTFDFKTANMVPAVDADNCETSVFADATDLLNAPAVNLSSETPTATAANLTDTTEANNIENALAHRALLRGDDLYVGYSYTPDWGLTTYTTLGNYNFWLRHYDGTTNTWTNPVNLTNISDTTINAREPRLVGTPSGAGQNASAFIVAWGTQTNVPEHLGGAEDLEIYYTRTFDKGVTFEPVVTVANPTSDARFESQLRPSQDAETLYAAWNQESASGTNAMFSIGTTIAAPAPPVAPVEPVEPVVSSGGGGGGGCTYNPDAKFDPTLPALLLLALGYLGLRRQKREE